MTTTHIPGFTGEASLYKSSGYYCLTGTLVEGVFGSQSVRPSFSIIGVIGVIGLVGQCQTVCFVNTAGRLVCTNCCDNGDGTVSCGTLHLR